MKIILIVILVSNGRFYTETPMYTIEFPTEAACLEKAVTYAKRGINYEAAVCVPKVSNVEPK